jgi:hypothetical protein
MKRFSIMVRSRHSDHEVELCQCDSNPQAVVDAALQKSLMSRGKPGARKVRVPLYEHARFIDNNK